MKTVQVMERDVMSPVGGLRRQIIIVRESVDGKRMVAGHIGSQQTVNEFKTRYSTNHTKG